MTRFRTLSAAAALAVTTALAAPGAAVAAEYFTLTLENDFFVGKDNGYSNGIGISWARDGFDSFEAGELPGWLTDDLYISTLPGRQRAVSYTLAQTMQTPDDLEAEQLIADEAPYAGILHASATLHAYDARTADALSLTLGMVGPASGAEKAQKLVHSATGSDDPKGWHNQLENELVFQIAAERLLRLRQIPVSTSTGLEIIGIGRGELGTLRSRLLGGFGLRYGHALERSFATTTALPGRKANLLAGSAEHSWNVFFNVLGAYVLNDITIDGNTFEDSHSVPLQHWQAMAVAGFGYGFGRLAVQFSTVTATARYDGEQEPSRFGALSLTYRF